MEHRTDDQQLPKDRQLWQLAQKRASFKYHAASYFLVNGFFWALWFFNGGDDRFPWPLYPALGWGIGLAFHYMGAYVFPGQNLVQKEYEKLTKGKNY